MRQTATAQRFEAEPSEPVPGTVPALVGAVPSWERGTQMLLFSALVHTDAEPAGEIDLRKADELIGMYFIG